MSLDYIVSVQDQEPVPPRYRIEQPTELQDFEALLASANAVYDYDSPRAISGATLLTISEREAAFGDAHVARELDMFINTVNNPRTANPTRHTDLLPKGHPLGGFAFREDLADYYASDPQFKDDKIRTLIASAIIAEPFTVDREFYMQRLAARGVTTAAVIAVLDADSFLGDN
jgi:hypothetical protein